ncbi:MAG: HesA/MoeB/ThiF family protein [Candidatus Hodarchaeales archaeon]|jgi:ubiquitin-activating enzyme E1 C
MSNFTSKTLTKEEKRRFDRQFRLPGWNQEILKQSSVLIAGIGGLGVEIAKNLAMVGVGNLILVDLDTIEYSNLNRQILFIDAPEGASKAKIAAKKLREMNPFITIDAFDCPLQDLPPRIYNDVDIYIAGLDSIEARSELNRRAVHNKKYLIDAGTSVYNGHAYVVSPFNNACLECDPLTERAQDQLGACTLVGKPRRPAHCILKGQLKFEQKHGRPVNILNSNEVQEVTSYANKLQEKHFSQEEPFSIDKIIQIIDNHEPTVITINCVMASLQSQEAVKILHHLHTQVPEKRLGNIQLNYLIYNGLTGKFYEIEKPRNPKCEMCGQNRTSIFRIRVQRKYHLTRLIQKFSQDKNYPLDPEFPPMMFRIDSSDIGEINLDQTISKAGIRDCETVLITGFDDGSQVYLTLKLEG